MLAQTPTPLWPLGLYFAVVLVMVVGMVLLSFVLGQRHRQRATGEPFESGMAPTGSARLRFPAEFYLVAMFFVIFDLESVFLFAWAVSIHQTGWFGYAEAVIFIAVLAAALAYLWRCGALDFGAPKRGRRPAAELRSTKSEIRNKFE